MNTITYFILIHETHVLFLHLDYVPPVTLDNLSHKTTTPLNYEHSQQ